MYDGIRDILYLHMLYTDPNDFYLLTLLSAVMVLLALVVFTRSREPSLEVPSSSRELQHLLHIQNNNQYGAAESSNQDEHTMTSLEFELTPPRQEVCTLVLLSLVLTTCILHFSL